VRMSTNDSHIVPTPTSSLTSLNQNDGMKLSATTPAKKEEGGADKVSTDCEQGSLPVRGDEELPSLEQLQIATNELDVALGVGGEQGNDTNANTSVLSPPHHHQSRSMTTTTTITESESNLGERGEVVAENEKKGYGEVKQIASETTTSSSFPLPPKPTAASSSSSSSTTNFAQLAYRTLETYVSEAIHEAKAEQFPPLQMLQHMNICDVTGEGFARLTHSVSAIGSQSMNNRSGNVHGRDRRPSKPIALRHIRSTPLQHTPSNLLDDEDEKEPPPIGLDILNRSRSTPLSMSKNSAFVRSNSQLSQDLSLSRQGSNSSAFTALAPYPMKKGSSRSTETDVKPVIFNPIKLPADDIDDEMGEMTSIEIVNIPKRGGEEGGENVDSKHLNPASQTMTAASKAAKKFFSDVRKLRGARQKVRSGRENPAQPPSVSDDSLSSSRKDDETLSSKSSSGASGAMGSYVKVKNPARTMKTPPESSSTTANAAGHKKDKAVSSEGMANGDRGSCRTFDGIDSPSTVPSPVYQQLDESPARPASDQVFIEVSSNVDRLSLVSSPEPGRSGRSGGASTPHSQGSPETSRYSSTTSSSGHTTHATNTTCSSGQGTTSLSAISETDREVMELNNGGVQTKVGRARERDGETIGSDKAENIELSLASGRNVRFGDYVELVDTPSPVNPRDGATVQADRFFTFNNKSEKRGLARLRSLPSVKRGGSSHSPTTISSASADANSSVSTMAGDEPPMIVSYIDRKLDKKQVSDLTSHHHRETQSSSPRSGVDDRELRESSPSDHLLVDDSDVIFEGSQSPKDAVGTSNRPRPIWPAKGLQFGRKIRSLPPRSPHKGLRGSSTPPPRGGSPTAAALSPPRQISDQHDDPNVLSSADKSYVVAPTSSRLQPSGVSTQALSSTSNIVNYTHIPGGEATVTALGDHGNHEVIRISPTPAAYYNMSTGLPRGHSPLGHGRATYEENSIEILKTNSKEEVASTSSSPVLVTPDHASNTSSSC
jgi:hypothetical protein